MRRLFLSNDRTEVNMDRLAGAFSISRDELETRLGLGTITYWFEQGASDDATPRMVFRASDTGAQVALDRVGNIISQTVTEAGDARTNRPRAGRRASFTEDPGLSDATPAPEDSPRPAILAESERLRRRHLDALLDEALAYTFPASDPIAVSFYK